MSFSRKMIEPLRILSDYYFLIVSLHSDRDEKLFVAHMRLFIVVFFRFLPCSRCSLSYSWLSDNLKSGRKL